MTILTDDELTAIRARCTAEKKMASCEGTAYQYQGYYRQDVPALLDALEKMRAERDDYKHRADELFAAADFAGDRDRWKTRAEALERFVQEARATHLYPCTGCIHQPARNGSECKWEPGCWVFDEARYAEGGDGT